MIYGVKSTPAPGEKTVEPASMKVQTKVHAMSGEIIGLRFYIRGAAGRLPSVSNSRLNWFPKEGVLKTMSIAADKLREGFHNANFAQKLIREAMQKLHSTRVISGVAPEYRDRLKLLTMLWNQHGVKLAGKLPLDCTKERRWVVTLHLADITNRMDTHNIQKGVLDWLQEVGVIKNDAYVDCFPTRNRDFELDANELVISMKPLEGETKELCKTLITHMYGD